MVRDSEEDSLLDATIALEALILSDGGVQEMTHKLAMRIGALSKLDVDFEKEPKIVFSDVKKIYQYRLSIVHGNKNVDKNRYIQINTEEKIPTATLAVEYLKLSLKILLNNPDYITYPNKIDENLLLNIET